VRLDIVMPAHNEEERIDRTLRAYRDACPQTGVRFLVALDSCTDRTPEIVRAHERADDRVRAIEYPKLGKGGVIAETFSRSDAELVGFVDADCATPPRELLRLARAARHTDGAKVLRRHVVRDVLPRLASRDLLFDVDLLAAARDGGWRVVEVPTVWIDQEGSRVSAVSDSRRMGASLLRLWLRRRMRGRRHLLSRGVQR
jgi:glycosyltransferase involved in cell wall biosynthesis